MRLIDAEALEEEIVKTMRYVPKDAVLDVACMVNRAPTIEAKPVVHAHWECAQWYEHQCSNCGDFALLNDKNIDCKSNYCPHCGAVMDEVIDNDKRRKKT